MNKAQYFALCVIGVIAVIAWVKANQIEQELAGGTGAQLLQV
jgi:hypothetical protein